MTAVPNEDALRNTRRQRGIIAYEPGSIAEILMNRIFLALTLVMCACPIFAADKDRAYGSQRPASCRDFLKVYRADDRRPEFEPVRNWIAGYITAYNRQTPDTYDIVGTSDFEHVLQSVERHCKDDPFSNVGAAMEAVTADLYPTRHQTRRQAGR